MNKSNINGNKVKKAIILAAGWGTRFLPLTKETHKELLPILNKPLIHYLAEEAVAAGIEEVIVVISPRKLDVIRYFMLNDSLQNQLKVKNKQKLLKEVEATNNITRISIAIQNEQLGLGHAIAIAAHHINNEPFAVMLGDDLIDAKVPAIKQLIDAYNVNQQSIVGVQSVEDEDLHKYGVVKPVVESEKNDHFFKIKGAVEKPQKAEAPSNKAILGRYVFTPQIMDILVKLSKEWKNHSKEEMNVIDAFEELLLSQAIYAYEFEGNRYDLGGVEGFVKANIDFSLKNPEIAGKIKKHLQKILKD